MKPYIIFILIHLLAISIAMAETPIKVAVIDTGADPIMVQPCASGHRDFTDTGITDHHGHGRNISSIIDSYASGADYCQIYLKYFDPSASPKFNMRNTIAALKAAIEEKVDIINYSSGGVDYSIEEAALIKKALDSGIFIFAAAGNEKLDFAKTGCKYYPACVDPRIVVVGCKDEEGKLCPQSNQGPQIDLYANGYQVNAGGQVMTGTSQATAIITGKFIRFWDKRRNGER